MSLINQMLQDLERRSSGLPSSTKFIPASESKSLGTDQEKTKKHAFLKVTGTLILVYCAAFLWVKNPNLFAFFNKAATPDQVAPPPGAQPIVADEVAQAPASTAPSATAPKITVVEATPEENAEKNKAQENQSVAQQDTATPVIEKTKKVAKKLVAQAKTGQLTAKVSDEEATPIVVAPKNAQETKKAESLAAEFKKPKLRQSNPQVETGFSKIESAEQKSNNLFNRAINAFDQGRVYEAQSYLNQAIEANPANEDARQTLAALLVDNKKISEAQALLADGLKVNPKNIEFRMAIARMQLESGGKKQALDTMMQGLSAGRHDAAYQSFLANLFQRDDHHDEAAAHFSAATQLRPSYANDYVGLGISLQALQKYEDARSAYSRALTMDKLSPELKVFVDQQMRLINQTLAMKD